MPSRSLTAAVILVAAVPSSWARDDDGLAAVRRGKAATALVVLPAEQGFGSAFCVDAAGFFVTNEHVVRGLPAGKTVTLVVNPADDGERAVEATVVRTDSADLALLRAADPKGLTALELGSADGLTETQSVTALGYPFGDRLAVRERKYPAVSVNVGRVTALRKAKDGLEAIQIDAQVNPGNSGGPLVDAKGRVVGVVTAGVRGAGVNFAVPVSKVREFVRKPEVVFTPPAVPYARRHEPARFTVRVVALTGSAPKATVELTLAAGGTERKFAAKPAADGTFAVEAVPATERPKRVPVTLIFPAPSALLDCQKTI